MSRRTQIFTKAPWNGGINNSVDPGALPDNDLVQADDVIFATSGSRLKREGFGYFDHDLPLVIKRSSVGTTRTLQFASSISITSPVVDQLLTVGESIQITSMDSSESLYIGSHTIASITTTTLTNDTITYSALGSLTESSTTVTVSFSLDRNAKYLDVKDYWRFKTSDNKKHQLVMAFSSQGKMFKHDTNGNRTEILNGGTPLTTTPLTSAYSIVFNERYIVAMSGIGNKPFYFRPEVDTVNFLDLEGNPPDCSILMDHLNRLFTDDKTNPDRLRYCATGDPTNWQGLSDSGAIDIYPGDGDVQGIVAIFPSFKDVLFIAKGNKLYQMAGYTPETFQVKIITSGLGANSHRSVALVDQDDILFMSKKGMHSLIASNIHGDFSGSFLSLKIQQAFNTWPKNELAKSSAIYIPELNSIAFSVTEENFTEPNAIWFFNAILKEWYRWPNAAASELATMFDGNLNRRLIWGTADSRIVLTQNSEFTDRVKNSTINYQIGTGRIYPDGNPQTLKMFKKLSFFYRPKGRYSFTVTTKIDNNEIQANSFAQSITGDLLGVNFILGTSVLGSSAVFNPFTVPIDGIGRGITINIQNNNSDEQVEIYGFSIEWESADIAQETV